MAFSSQICSIFVFSFLSAFVISSSYQNQHEHAYGAFTKSMHFSAYLHDTYNKTDFMIAKGQGKVPLTATSSPLGSMFVLNDPLTATSNPSSERLGNMEMVLITSTLDGHRGITVFKATLQLKDGHKGSVALAGVFLFKEPSDYPVVGGTGDFLFVQGYVTSSFVSHQGLNDVFKYEFHLFWPPYAFAPHKA